MPPKRRVRDDDDSVASTADDVDRHEQTRRRRLRSVYTSEASSQSAAKRPRSDTSANIARRRGVPLSVASKITRPLPSANFPDKGSDGTTRLYTSNQSAFTVHKKNGLLRTTPETGYDVIVARPGTIRRVEKANFVPGVTSGYKLDFFRRLADDPLTRPGGGASRLRAMVAHELKTHPNVHPRTAIHLDREAFGPRSRAPNADTTLRHHYQKIGFRNIGSMPHDRPMYSTMGRVARGRKGSVTSTQGLDM